MMTKNQNAYLEWKEPFQYKRWKHKKLWAQFPMWRFYATYALIFVLTSALFAICFFLLNKFVLHEGIILSKIIYKSSFIGLLICFLLFIVSFDTTKVKIQENGISYYYGGEWTEYKYSNIISYKIEDIFGYSKPLKFIKLKLNTGDDVMFGIHPKIDLIKILDIFNSNIKETEQLH